MKVVYALPILVLLGLAACSDPKQKKVEKLRKETIDIHDEVMPRIMEINSLQQAINKQRTAMPDSLSPQDSMANAEAQVLLVKLEAAHTGMMDWMDAIKMDYEVNKPVDSAIVYYENEKRAITRVKADIENSIQDAKEWIEARRSGQ